MTTLKYALLCTILVQAMLLQAVSISKLQEKELNLEISTQDFKELKQNNEAFTRFLKNVLGINANNTITPNDVQKPFNQTTQTKIFPVPPDQNTTVKSWIENLVRELPMAIKSIAVIELDTLKNQKLSENSLPSEGKKNIEKRQALKRSKRAIDLDFIKTLSLPYTSGYGYQPQQSYSSFFHTQPSLLQAPQTSYGGYSSLSTPALSTLPLQQSNGYGSAITQPIVQQSNGYSAAITQPIAQQQSYGGYSAPALTAPVQQPIVQQQSYGGYSAPALTAPVQ
jgi:hypothetical protein